MRFIFIIVLCCTLIISTSMIDQSENEISIDQENSVKDGENSIENEKSDVENELLGQEVASNLEETYKNSVQAYLEEDWDACIDGFNKAIRRYKEYKKAVIKCRRDCRESATGSQPIFPYNIEDLHFYEKKLRETLCLMNCNQNYRDSMGPNFFKRLPKDIEKKFADFSAYEYLQMCYYKKNRFQEAANAVFTYLTLHPKHEMSLKNFQFYLDLPDVDESKVTNYEVEPFVMYYVNGVTAYDEGRYSDVIKNFENSIKLYIKSEEDCRFYCEGHFNQGWHPEFTSSVANHFTYCLKCKQSCSIRMDHVNGEYHADLLPTHYHYLQFAYYKVGDIKSTCAAVSSYLLFYPSEETMLKNERYYASLPKVEADYFTPRREAVEYVKRQQYEKRLSRFIGEEFRGIAARMNATSDRSDKKTLNKSEEQLTNHPPPGHSPAFELPFTRNETTEWEMERNLDDFWHDERSINIEKKISIVADGNDLGGELRYLAKGFLNLTECKNLIYLAKIGAVEGDGYEGKMSPHSKYERFEGLTLGRAALLVYFGYLEVEILELALSSTRAVRDHVEKYFNLDRRLYFTYTHLACRSALPDSRMDRQDLSHAIHADNCVILENGTCVSEWPAYTFRDYSAIMYLNEDFEGGEFVFAGDSRARIIQSTIEPSCGRMIAFSASEKNLHGVRGVLRGTRCALALWFTFDEDNIETERLLARAIVKKVRVYGRARPKDGEDIDFVNYEGTLFRLFESDAKLRLFFEFIRNSRSEN